MLLKKPTLPDFKARLPEIYGEKVISAEAMAEDVGKQGPILMAAPTYADTSFLVSLYVQDAHSERAGGKFGHAIEVS